MSTVKAILLLFTNTVYISIIYTFLFGEFSKYHITFLTLNITYIIVFIVVSAYNHSYTNRKFKGVMVRNFLLYALILIANQLDRILNLEILTTVILILIFYLILRIFKELISIDNFPIPKVLVEILDNNLSDSLSSKEDIDNLIKKSVNDKKNEDDYLDKDGDIVLDIEEDEDETQYVDKKDNKT